MLGQVQTKLRLGWVTPKPAWHQMTAVRNARRQFLSSRRVLVSADLVDGCTLPPERVSKEKQMTSITCICTNPAHQNSQAGGRKLFREFSCTAMRWLRYQFDTHASLRSRQCIQANVCGKLDKGSILYTSKC